jgi:hypothetical protein
MCGVNFERQFGPVLHLTLLLGASVHFSKISKALGANPIKFHHVPSVGFKQVAV